jgi:hypothetical protein
MFHVLTGAMVAERKKQQEKVLLLETKHCLESRMAKKERMNE